MPDDLVPHDKTIDKPIFGNPEFKIKNGRNIEDFLPQNTNLIIDKGIEISKIPGDEIGLILDLKVEKDILGNPVKGRPDMGALEL